MATVQAIAAATSRLTVGTGSAELVINGYVTPHFKGGLWQVNAMRAEALHLVDSLGDVWRDFVVTAITETRRDIGPAGLPSRIGFQVTLRSTEVNPQGRRALPAAPFPFIAPAGL